jgi:hypothetical protein
MAVALRMLVIETPTLSLVEILLAERADVDQIAHQGVIAEVPRAAGI